MVEDRKRPRYWEPTMASKARQKPPLREPSTRYHNHNQHFAPPPKSSKRIHHHPPEEVLVMKIPNSHSGQSVQYSWSSNSTSGGNPTEGELALMQTSSSSNESRSSAKKVVASYSNCALAQKPIYPGQKKTEQPKMVTSMTSSGKSSISPLSEGEAKVCDYFDDEIDDQPDLTLYENDSIKGLTPASEFPPSNFASALKAQGVKKGGGESDARDLASELFLAGKTPEDETGIKDSSLNASLESLEHDQQQHDR